MVSDVFDRIGHVDTIDIRAYKSPLPDSLDGNRLAAIDDALGNRHLDFLPHIQSRLGIKLSILALNDGIEQAADLDEVDDLNASREQSHIDKRNGAIRIQTTKIHAVKIVASQGRDAFRKENKLEGDTVVESRIADPLQAVWEIESDNVPALGKGFVPYLKKGPGESYLLDARAGEGKGGNASFRHRSHRVDCDEDHVAV